LKKEYLNDIIEKETALRQIRKSSLTASREAASRQVRKTASSAPKGAQGKAASRQVRKLIFTALL